MTYLSAMQGYISAEELLNIPELSINPLTRRLERMFDSVNFKVLGAPYSSAHDMKPLRMPLQL